MKTVILLRAHETDLAKRLPDLVAARPWAAKADRIVVQAGIATSMEAGRPPVPPAYDAVIELWSNEPLADAVTHDALLGGLAALDVRTSDEVIAKPGPRPGPGITPGLSQLAFLEPVPGQPRTETLRHWSEHIRLAVQILVGMDRYVHDRLSNPQGDAPPYFGMAHLHFPDEAALRDGLFRAQQDPDAISHVAEFISGYVMMLAIEHVVKG